MAVAAAPVQGVGRAWIVAAATIGNAAATSMSNDSRPPPDHALARVEAGTARPRMALSPAPLTA